jgi:hypothetical protein
VLLQVLSLACALHARPLPEDAVSASTLTVPQSGRSLLQKTDPKEPKEAKVSNSPARLDGCLTLHFIRPCYVVR